MRTSIWMVATSPATVSGWLDSHELRLALCADFDRTIASRVTSMERAVEYALALSAMREAEEGNVTLS